MDEKNRTWRINCNNDKHLQITKKAIQALIDALYIMGACVCIHKSQSAKFWTSLVIVPSNICVFISSYLISDSWSCCGPTHEHHRAPEHVVHRQTREARLPPVDVLKAWVCCAPLVVLLRSWVAQSLIWIQFYMNSKDCVLLHDHRVMLTAQK